MLTIYTGDAMASYGYDEKPWFRPHERAAAFFAELARRGLDRRVTLLEAPPASDRDILAFHTPEHLRRVRELCARNEGALDHGPTFARASIERAATHMVGAVMDAARKIAAGALTRAFVPIAGFHHAFADQARMYCLYNDCAIALRYLTREARLAPCAYVDVDVHHGDGVYAGFASDPAVVIADLHEDARTLFPHSPEAPGAGPFAGDANCRGEGAAVGTKLNLPLPAGAGDAQFLRAWEQAEDFLASFAPRMFVLEAGIDGLAGDPMAHLALTPAAIAHVTRRVRALADRFAQGRLLVLGGGGYELRNLPDGWCAVVEALLD